MIIVLVILLFVALCAVLVIAVDRRQPSHHQSQATQLAERSAWRIHQVASDAVQEMLSATRSAKSNQSGREGGA